MLSLLLTASEKVSPSTASAGRRLSSLTLGINSDPSAKYKVVVGPRNGNTGELVGSSSPGLGNHRQHRIASSLLLHPSALKAPHPSQHLVKISRCSSTRTQQYFASTRKEAFAGIRLLVTHTCACSDLSLFLSSCFSFLLLAFRCRMKSFLARIRQVFCCSPLQYPHPSRPSQSFLASFLAPSPPASSAAA